MGRKFRRMIRRKRIINKLTGQPLTDVDIQKNKEEKALKDPLANSTNRGEQINTNNVVEFNEVGLEDSVDFTQQLNKTQNNKDKLKKMLSL